MVSRRRTQRSCAGAAGGGDQGWQLIAAARRTSKLTSPWFWPSIAPTASTSVSSASRWRDSARRLQQVMYAAPSGPVTLAALPFPSFNGRMPQIANWWCRGLYCQAAMKTIAVGNMIKTHSTCARAGRHLNLQRHAVCRCPVDQGPEGGAPRHRHLIRRAQQHRRFSDADARRDRWRKASSSTASSSSMNGQRLTNTSRMKWLAARVISSWRWKATMTMPKPSTASCCAKSPVPA